MHIRHGQLAFGRTKSRTARAFMVVTALTLLATSAACSGSNESPANSSNNPAGLSVEPGPGFGPARPDAAPGDKWWLTAPTGTIKVTGGTPSAIVRLSMSLVATPCGPVSAKLAGQAYAITSRSQATALLTLASDGSGSTNISASGNFCQPRGEDRTLYALVSEPIAVPVGTAGSPTTVPMLGFANREGTDQAYGYWMTSATATIQVVGKPSSNVTVSMSLAPTPCGPATAFLGSTKYQISASTPVSIPMKLDASGSGLIPVKATSTSCSPPGDGRALYAMVFDPKATAA